MMQLVRSLAREPVVHFLLGGLILYAVSLWHARRTDPRTIVVDRHVTAMLSERFANQYGVLPTPPQLEELKRQHVRDEVLYREGLATGLGEDDEVIRRRIIQKMSFLIEGGAAEPDDKDLAAYFRVHPERYLQPPRATFTQVYFSPDLDGDKAARERARQAMGALNAGDEVPGDFFPGQRTHVLVGPDDMAKMFGRGELTERISALPLGVWAGPVRSGFGWHLVRVEGREEATLPAFADVRARVRTDWMADMQKQSMVAELGLLMRKYQVVRDDPVGGSER